MRILLSYLLVGLFTTSGLAGGPRKVAKSNRSLWPYAINSPAEFDFASKLEMLVFARVLQNYEAITIEDSIRSKLGLQKINIASINTWREKTKKTLLTNFRALKQTSSHDFLVIALPQQWNQVINASAKLQQTLPDNLKAWFTN